MGAGELLLPGIAACAVNMVERIAHDDQIPLEWMDVSVESYRDPDQVPGELSVYDDVRVHFQMWGLWTTIRVISWWTPGNGVDLCTVRSPWRPPAPA